MLSTRCGQNKKFQNKYEINGTLALKIIQYRYIKGDYEKLF
jgi:hypothetical protein